MNEILINTEAGVCDVAVPFTVTAMDNCPDVSFACVSAGATAGPVISGSRFNKGVSTVTCTATEKPFLYARP